MDVRACRSCGKLYNYIQGQPICNECKKKLEEKFVHVKDYIREHDDATMQQIAEENEVSIKQLKQWVREERLTFSSRSPVGIECEGCGKMIRTGRFCDKCKNDLSNNLKAMYTMPVSPSSDKQTRDRERMRFLDKT